MPRFIIGFGYGSDIAEIEADSLNAAEVEARARSIAVGVDMETIDDAAWAAPYDQFLARDLGLLPESDLSGFDFKAALKRGDATREPWR